MTTPHTKQPKELPKEPLSVEEAQAQFDAARLALGAAMKAQFDKVKNQFSDDFLDAAKSFADIPEEDRASVWKDKELAKVAKKMGLKPIEKPASAEPSETGDGAPVARYDEAAILALLADGPKKQLVIQKHFNTTKQSVGNWGKKLIKAGKIKIEDDATSKRENEWHKI